MRYDATRNRFATGSLLPGLLALCLLALLGCAAGDAEHVTLEKAEQEVEFLHDVLRSPRAVNDQILGALDAVASVLEHLPPPPALVTVPIPEDASEDRREELEDQNDRAERDWKKALRKHERAVERLRDDAEDLVLDALKETKLNSGSNVREPVNIRAARLIGTWDDPKVARKVQRILERHVLDAKYPVSDRMLEEGFAALAHIGEPDVPRVARRRVLPHPLHAGALRRPASGRPQGNAALPPRPGGGRPSLRHRGTDAQKLRRRRVSGRAEQHGSGPGAREGLLGPHRPRCRERAPALRGEADQ